MLKFCSWSLIAVVALAGSASAETWGDLKIQFKVAGKAPAADPAKVTKDAEFCGKHKLVNETLVVGPGGELANVFVYLVPAAGKKVPVCPDLPVAAPSITLDNTKCRYAPHALVLQTSQKLVIGNKDPLGHNTKGEFLGNGVSFNDLIPANGSVSKTFAKSESIPMPVVCSIHEWMSSRVLIRDDPYAAVSDEMGNVTIPKVPTGKWTFVVYHEGSGFVSKASVGGKAAEWKKGRVEIEISEKGTDFGVVEIPLELLQKNK